MTAVSVIIRASKEVRRGRTKDADHTRLYGAESCSLGCEFGAGGVRLAGQGENAMLFLIRSCKVMMTYSNVSSIIWCEESILPRSARRESVADDLYALSNAVECKSVVHIL